MAGDDCDVCRSPSSAVAILQFGDVLAARPCADCLQTYSAQATCCFQCTEVKQLAEMTTVEVGSQAIRLCNLCKWQHEASPKKARTHL
jgi:hypothetical protein